ncbi:MAG: FAD-dependent oxidoreductase [Thermodesulfobacteriota bacterium]|nr:FAD-dependent oxidoreductase [Thermodesulfobacteriota bacterium]
MIIGNGISGATVALTLIKRDPNSKITLISEEPFHTYARMILPDYIAGHIGEKALFLFGNGRCNSIRMILGKRVEGMVPQENAIFLERGKKIYYENLLISSGASPSIPNIEGIGRKGVCPLRSIKDAREIIASATPGKKAVVLGGGLVGLEVTDGLVARGLKVEMVVGSPRILSRVFDQRGAKIIEAFLRERGIIIRNHTDVTGIDSIRNKKVVLLNTGEKLEGHLVIVAKGIKPNVDFINKNEILLDQGIVVNRKMQTGIHNVYATGDVAMAPGFFEDAPIYNAIWGEAIYQGIVAADNMAGEDHLYEGNLRANIFEVLGLKASSIGQGARPVEGSEIFSLEKSGSYKKLVFEQGRLVGALLIGDIEESGFLQYLIRKRINLGGKEETFLRNKVHYGMLTTLEK